MWWAVMIAAVATSACAAAAPAHDSLPPMPSLQMLQIDQNNPDEENMNSIPALGGSVRYETGAGAPWLYYIDETPRDSQAARLKRRMPALSIELPMSVLRQKLSLDHERRFHALRAAANRNYLDNIGKRDTVERARYKRKMPSLSINNPMEVLRQRLMLEVARKQLREASQRQAVANRVFLQNVGKRGFHSSRSAFHYDE